MSSIEKIILQKFKRYLPKRQRDAHKGDFGHVVIIGGDYGYAGAVRMAAEAALRVGAGLVSVVTRPEHALIINATRPEIMCHGINSVGGLKKLLAVATVIAIGPGLGRSIWSKKMVDTIFKSNLPLVVDADALNLLGEKPCRKNNWILTPHPGEAARLLKTSAHKIQQDRLGAGEKLQKKYGGIIVLKGAGSLVVSSHSKAQCDAGNPGMATAGMGDVLTGVIAGLVAQKVPALIAAKLSVCLHARAGDLAAEAGGERGMVALDLMPYLRDLVNP